MHNDKKREVGDRPKPPNTDTELTMNITQSSIKYFSEPSDNVLLTITEAHYVRGWPKAKIRSMIYAGTIRCVKMGEFLRIPRSELFKDVD